MYLSDQIMAAIERREEQQSPWNWKTIADDIGANYLTVKSVVYRLRNRGVKIPCTFQSHGNPSRIGKPRSYRSGGRPHAAVGRPYASEIFSDDWWLDVKVKTSDGASSVVEFLDDLSETVEWTVPASSVAVGDDGRAAVSVRVYSQRRRWVLIYSDNLICGGPVMVGRRFVRNTPPERRACAANAGGSVDLVAAVELIKLLGEGLGGLVRDEKTAASSVLTISVESGRLLVASTPKTLPRRTERGPDNIDQGRKTE